MFLGKGRPSGRDNLLDLKHSISMQRTWVCVKAEPTGCEHIRRQGRKHLLSINRQGTDDSCQDLDGVAGGLDTVEKRLHRFLKVFVVCTWKPLGVW